MAGGSAMTKLNALGAGSSLIRSLVSALPGIVSLPGSEQYAESNGSYWAAFENELSPSCIVRPADAQDISKLVKHLKPSVDRGECKIAIRSGGHMPWSGAANIDDGITIDLRAVKGVRLNRESAIAEIPTGETWGSVYSQLEKEGYTVAGGRVATVGVGGLITGGESPEKPQ